MYLDEEREKVIEEVKKTGNQITGMNMSMGYALYDLMRLQLEELHRIGNAMECILEIIQTEK